MKRDRALYSDNEQIAFMRRSYESLTKEGRKGYQSALFDAAYLADILGKEAAEANKRGARVTHLGETKLAMAKSPSGKG